jgi:hypothetical protein
MPLDMSDWVREKLGSVIESMARIADIAKDPETPRWYTRNLRQHLSRGFHDGLKVLMWAHERQDDWEPDHATLPTEKGTMGLVVLLNELQIPHRTPTDEAPYDPGDDEDRLPTNPPGLPQPAEEPWITSRRQFAFKRICDNLAHKPKDLGDDAARLLAWIGYLLTTELYEDIVLLTPDFIGKDVGISNDAGRAALDRLVDLGLVRVVDELRFVHRQRIPVQVVVDGLNDPRHEPTRH